jgi:hypothetical protein
MEAGVVFSGSDGHQFRPPFHDAIGFGKEAMATDIHAIAVVADGAGDTADALRCFEYDGAHVGAAQQLKGSGEAGRTGSDNQGSLHAANI